VTGTALVDQDFLEPFFERNINFHNQIQAENPLAHTIRDLVYEIENENEKAFPGYQLMIKASLLKSWPCSFAILSWKANSVMTLSPISIV